MGPEAAARDARHAALEAAAAETGAGVILLGHTLDDQAEQVLLGLARGSGTRSLAGMRPARGRLLRPFLGLRRAETLEICEVEDLDPWHDPSNADPAFARSRTRVEVLPLLEEKLGPGVAESLARTAAILQQDADYLEDVANDTFARLREQSGAEISLPEAALRELAPAVRFRVIAKAAAAVGGQQPSYQRLLAAEALLRRQGSAGPVELPGGVSVYRLSLAQLLRRSRPPPPAFPARAPAVGSLYSGLTDRPENSRTPHLHRSHWWIQTTSRQTSSTFCTPRSRSSTGSPSSLPRSTRTTKAAIC